MIEQFAYVASQWYGDRTTHIQGQYYLEKHLAVLKNGLEGNVLTVFPINSADGRMTRDIQDTDISLGKYRPLDPEPVVIHRPNVDGSYGAWHDAVMWLLENRPDIRYALLIEDDYIPTCPDFSVPFLRALIETDAAYACQIWGAAIWSGARFEVEFAVVPSGAIDLKKARTVFDKDGVVFTLNGGSDHNALVGDQITFLDNLKMRYPIIGLNGYGHPFLGSIAERIGVGDMLNQTIAPIE